MKPEKVAIVCPYDWSHPGGVRSHVIGLRGALEAKDVAVEVLAPSTEDEREIFRTGGALPIPANGSIARVGFSRAGAGRIEERLSQGDIDLIHVHEPAVPSASLLSLMVSDLPSVATFHASRDRSWGYLLGGPILRRWIDDIDQRIAVSKAALALASRYLGGSFELIPNGVDRSRFADAEPHPDLTSLGPFVLFVGRPEPRKGFPTMIAAMEVLRSKVDAPLVAVGPRRQDVPAWVVALGPVSQEELPSIYRAAAVYCAPSTRGESFGIVLAEAMSAGCPVVCSDLPGYRAAAGKAALFTRVNDAVDVAGALDRVLRDPGLAGELSELGQQRSRHLDWSLLVDNILDVYERAYDGR